MYRLHNKGSITRMIHQVIGISGKGREQDAVSFTYMDVGKGREQDAVSFAYMDVGKGQEQDALRFSES